MTAPLAYEFTARLWPWEVRRDLWTFVTLPGDASEEIAEAFDGLRRGFGSVPVRVRIGTVTWRTSVFPQQKGGPYVLPVKRAVRTSNAVGVGDEVAVRLEVLRQLGLEPATAARYVAALPGDHAGDALGRYTTDLVFRRQLASWVEARRGPASTWVYDFAWPSALNGISGHCLDVPFVFDVLAHPHVATIAGADAPQSLADTVHGSYASFVRGDTPGWQPHNGSGEVMVWDADPHVATGTYESARVLAETP